MYDQALGLFQVEIRKAGRGHLVFVVDENGNPIRYPVKMSDFQERPKFYSHEQQNLNQRYKQHLNLDQTGLSTGVLKSLVLKEFMRQVNPYNRDYQTKTRQKLKIQRKKGKRF